MEDNDRNADSCKDMEQCERDMVVVVTARVYMWWQDGFARGGWTRWKHQMRRLFYFGAKKATRGSL